MPLALHSLALAANTSTDVLMVLVDATMSAFIDLVEAAMSSARPLKVTACVVLMYSKMPEDLGALWPMV